MAFVSELEAGALTRIVQRVRPIDETHGVVAAVSLAAFGQKRTSENIRRCRLKLCVQHLVRLGIDSGVQPGLSPPRWIMVSSTATRSDDRPCSDCNSAVRTQVCTADRTRPTPNFSGIKTSSKSTTTPDATEHGLHHQPRCHLPFDKFPVYLVDTTTETCVLGHRLTIHSYLNTAIKYTKELCIG